MHVDPPEALASRILLKKSFQERNHPAWRVFGYGLAASLLLNVGLAVKLLLPEERTPSLEQAISAHMENEPYALTGQARSVALAAVLKPLGAKLEGDLGEVSFANLCAILKRPAAHIVLAGEQGPVTVLLLPERKVAQRKRFKVGRWAGLAVPMTRGSAIIVGEPQEPLAATATRVRSAVRWQL